MSNLGNELKRQRMSKNLNQTELAKKLGKSQSDISKYENGEMELPKELFPQLSVILGVPDSWFWDALILDSRKMFNFDDTIDLDKYEKFIDAVIVKTRESWKAYGEEQQEEYKNWLYPAFKYCEILEEFHFGDKHELLKECLHCLSIRPKSINDISYLKYLGPFIHIWTITKILEFNGRTNDVETLKQCMSFYNMAFLYDGESKRKCPPYIPSIVYAYLDKILEAKTLYYEALNRNILDELNPINNKNKKYISYLFYCRIYGITILCPSQYSSYEDVMKRYLKEIENSKYDGPSIYNFDKNMEEACRPCKITFLNFPDKELLRTRLAKKYEDKDCSCFLHIDEFFPWILGH